PPSGSCFCGSCRWAMTRRYGRAPAGERVVAAAPGAWKNVTTIVGLRPTAVVAPFVLEGATDGAAFGTYVPEVLQSIDQATHRITEIAQQVPTVGHLDGLRSARAGSYDVVVGTVTGDDLDLGMIAQPSAKGLCGSLGQEVHRTAAFQ